MTSKAHDPNTHLSAIENSILYDKDTFLWFDLLLRARSLAPELRPRLLTRRRLITFLYGLLFVAAVLLALTAPQTRLWPAAAAAAALAGSIISRRQWQQAVARQGRALVAHHYPQLDVRTHTLYRIGEELAQRYGVPSLVDIIATRDHIRFHAAIFGVFLAVITLPPGIKVGHGLLITAAVFWGAPAVVESIWIAFLRSRRP